MIIIEKIFLLAVICSILQFALEVYREYQKHKKIRINNKKGYGSTNTLDFSLHLLI